MSMAQSYVGQKRVRRYYGKIREVLEMPNLIEVQKSSYDLFLKSGDGQKATDGEGIQGVFQSVFPIKDFNETPSAGIREIRAGKAEIRRGRVPAARHDLCRAAEGDARLIVFDVDEKFSISANKGRCAGMG